MRRSNTLAALTLIAALTACSTAATSDPVKRQADGWEVTNTMMRFEAPGMPADMLAGAKQSVGKPDVGVVCLKPETVANDTLATRLNDVIQLSPEWKVTKSELTNGKVAFAASFEQPGQGKGEMTINGTLSSTAADLTVVSKGTDASNAQVESESRMQTRHLGKCPPDAAEM